MKNRSRVCTWCLTLVYFSILSQFDINWIWSTYKQTAYQNESVPFSINSPACGSALCGTAAIRGSAWEAVNESNSLFISNTHPHTAHTPSIIFIIIVSTLLTLWFLRTLTDRQTDRRVRAQSSPFHVSLPSSLFFFLQWICEDDLHAALQRNTTQYYSKSNIEVTKKTMEEKKTRHIPLECPSAHSETRRLG